MKKSDLEITRRVNGKLVSYKVKKVCFASGGSAAISLPKELIGKSVIVSFDEVKDE